MCPLHVLLLWALFCPGTGNVPIPKVEKNIFTRPGSDLLFPIRHHLTLNHTDTGRCDGFFWYYVTPSRHLEQIAVHANCELTEYRYFPNTRISENGSLIISNVTLENDGRFFVYAFNSAGQGIQREHHIVHVEDIDDCAENVDLCGNGRCLNTPRGYRCDCDVGFLPSIDGKTCEDIDECALSDLCDSGICVNLPGLYRCDCDVGYVWDRSGDRCTDIDECALSNLCVSGTCKNLPGLFRCDCDVGYEWDRSGGRCTDIDECALPNLCVSGTCKNLPGLFRCDCDVGYEWDRSGGRCTGNVPEEIFTRLGSDLLLPIRRHLTLNHKDTERCDRFTWYYKTHSKFWVGIAEHRRCDLTEFRYFPNTRISVNGSLIISHVTLENNGIYIVDIENSTGDIIQRHYYIIHVEVPVSVPLLHVSCPRNGSAEISCRVEAGTKPNIHLSVIGGSQEKYSTSANNITAIVEPLGPWNITCTVENGVSRLEESRAEVTCPDAAFPVFEDFHKN